MTRERKVRESYDERKKSESELRQEKKKARESYDKRKKVRES